VLKISKNVLRILLKIILHQVCCLSCNTAECKQEESDWATYDTECVMQGGTCQYNSLPCSQAGYAYRTEFSCGGPAERQCCAPASKPTPPLTSEQTPPTVPPTFTPPPSSQSFKMAYHQANWIYLG